MLLFFTVGVIKEEGSEPTITMRRCLKLCHVFALVLCMSAREDFDWAKTERTSFYYGTFPTGKCPKYQPLLTKNPKRQGLANVFCIVVSGHFQNHGSFKLYIFKMLSQFTTMDSKNPTSQQNIRQFFNSSNNSSKQNKKV